MPQVDALNALWDTVPPPAVQLRRIALYLGLPETKKPVQTRALSAEEAIKEVMAAGIPVMEGRPDDPMLDFLDL